MSVSRTPLDATAPANNAGISLPVNPYVTGLWFLTGTLFLTAFIVRMVGSDKSEIGDGLTATFDPSASYYYYIAAFVIAFLGVVCLLATLRFQASRWKPSSS